MYQAAVSEAFCADLWKRCNHRWREMDERVAAREWVPDRPSPAMHRSTVSVSTAPVDRPLLEELWAHFKAANEYGFPIAALEIEGMNRYVGPRGYCNIHRDDRQLVGSDSALLSMTLVISPSDEYEGGEFIVHDPGGPSHRLRPERGGVVVFPSSWRHGVSTITSGTRYAFVARATTLTPPHNPLFRCGMEPLTGRLGYLPDDPSEWGRKYREQHAHDRAAEIAVREGREPPDRWT